MTGCRTGRSASFAYTYLPTNRYTVEKAIVLDCEGNVSQSIDGVLFDRQYTPTLLDNDKHRCVPSGAYAANVLGLSEQVPSRIVFLTDGPARKVKIGKREILLQHTTPRNMATAGRKSGMLIQALRYLGQDQVDKKILATIRRQITDSDHPILRDDLRYAPAWIADLLRPFTESSKVVNSSIRKA